MGHEIQTAEDFGNFVKTFGEQLGYRAPMAFGIGIAHLNSKGEMLDAFFPFPNYDSNTGSAAVMADVVGHLAGTATYRCTLEQLEKMVTYFRPFENDGKRHGNIDAIKAILKTVRVCEEKHGAIRAAVVSFIDSAEHDPGPQNVGDAYLRLHLLSHRLVKPNTINLDDIFDTLPNNAWTNEGPVDLADLPARRMDSLMRRHPLHVNAVDKFPRMVDYVVPSGVSIAVTSLVRLGAYLGAGTNVTHGDFKDFDARPSWARGGFRLP